MPQAALSDIIEKLGTYIECRDAYNKVGFDPEVDEVTYDCASLALDDAIDEAEPIRVDLDRVAHSLALVLSAVLGSDEAIVVWNEEDFSKLPTPPGFVPMQVVTWNGPDELGVEVQS